jgi:diacylglycerol kinase family enzyme
MMDRPDVVKYRQAVRVHATSTEHVQVEADGELLGMLPATFTVLAAQLQVVVGS